MIVLSSLPGSSSIFPVITLSFYSVSPSSTGSLWWGLGWSPLWMKIKQRKNVNFKKWAKLFEAVPVKAHKANQTEHSAAELKSQSHSPAGQAPIKPRVTSGRGLQCHFPDQRRVLKAVSETRVLEEAYNSL
ncbi:uncharacterized protein LOC125421275 [Ziziphus jujuba]|uniref:Uncharacterized protein LOC125421275 n=1 Tax=Ziziphus jujuba TaxID=326968 RepID=A0ABM4AFF2_ZIZJJ|nr:uncharacterized protein LOC125421275 [Ziziphus jujuba]